ncbi:hypothetical protein [Streptomyces sp. NBC_01465]|uniref:hypothetical protein n=1 Tax=Streptomyces sp. NBC_01465 TaxID=2903878 RepID=UPI002E37890C|nr:hypothetical protein [Streptomyces sp. NBC_01465]
MTTTHPQSAPSRQGLFLLVPLLVAVSAALTVAFFTFDGDTFQHCEYLGPSTRMYVTAWAAPVCALAAGALLRALRARPAGGLRTFATVAACLIPVLLLVQAFALYTVYADDPSGGDGCSGLGVLQALWS